MSSHVLKIRSCIRFHECPPFRTAHDPRLGTSTTSSSLAISRPSYCSLFPSLATTVPRDRPRSASSTTTTTMPSPDGPANHDVAEIVIVRHGETSWNAARVIQGHLDVELNEAGRRQAIVVGQRLSMEQSFAAMYSSDLKRAAETAQIISNCCDSLEVIQDPELRERNLGDLQGLTLKDAAKLKPKAYNDFLSYNSNQEISGGGESLDQLHQRCTSALEIIARKHKGERVLVVSHGGVIRELYKRALPHGSPQRKIANTSVNVFCISSDGKDWTIKTWGDISHLNETEFLKDSFGGDRTSG